MDKYCCCCGAPVVGDALSLSIKFFGRDKPSYCIECMTKEFHFSEGYLEEMIILYKEIGCPDFI